MGRANGAGAGEGAGAVPPRRRERIERRYHFHPPGVFYVGVTLFLAVGALNSQNNLLFLALGLAIGGLLVSGVISGSSLMGVRLERDTSGRARVGEALTIRYEVANRNLLMPAFGLTITELARGRAAGNRTGAFRNEPAFVVGVGAGETVRCAAIARPLRRGVARLDRVRVWTKFPFGLAIKSATFSRPHTLVVLPAVLGLRPGLVSRLCVRSATGMGAERQPGMGDEFFGLREYRPGDNPRRIAWKASARRASGELVVRQHASPAPQRLMVVVRFGGCADAEMELAIALAASVAAEAEREGVSVGLAVPCVGLVIAARSGRRHLDALLGELARLVVPAGAPEALPTPAARSGACVVIHGTAVDPSFGPRGATHLGVASLGEYLLPDENTAGTLELVRSAGAGDGAGRHRARQLRGLILRRGRTRDGLARRAP